MALRAALLALAATAVLMVPTAAAHERVKSADQQVEAVVGLLNEPVVTYATTGLDVCFRTLTGAAIPFPGNNSNEQSEAANRMFEVKLKAPNGEVYTEPLRTQFGKPGCVSFTNPLSLTRDGQYTVSLQSKGDETFNGTTFDVPSVKAGGAVKLQGNVTFPDEDTPDVRGLEAKVGTLEAQVTQLQAKVTEVQAAQEKGDDEGKFAPSAPVALTMLALVGLVAALRRRAA